MVDFGALKRMALGGGSGGGLSEGKARFGAGIGNEGVVHTAGTGAEDKWDRMLFFLRCSQVFFAAILLCCGVALALFQKKWIGSGPSGLTGLILALASLSIVASATFLVVPVVHERSDYKTFKSLNRALGEARVGFVVNGGWLGLGAILAMTQTISAYTLAGCKDPAKDAHAESSNGKKEDYLAALPGFCRTKRAGAAFCWFLFLTWVVSALLFLRSWRLTRKNGPRIPPFTHPTDDSAFEPITGDDVDEDDRGDYAAAAAQSARYGEGGDGRYGAGYDVRPSYDAGNPFGDTAAGARPSYDYGAYGSAAAALYTPHAPGGYAHSPPPQDPYAIINEQLNGRRAPERPPQLPPLYSH